MEYTKTYRRRRLYNVDQLIYYRTRRLKAQVSNIGRLIETFHLTTVVEPYSFEVRERFGNKPV